MQPFEFEISSTLWPVDFSVCTLDAFELLSEFVSSASIYKTYFNAV